MFIGGGSYVATARMIVSVEHFYSASHQQIYKAIIALDDRKDGVDLVTVAEYLLAHDQLEDVGGAAYLGEIADTVPHASHLRMYARTVAEKYVRRSIIYRCTETINKVYESADESADILEEAETGILSIRDDMRDEESSTADAAQSVFDQIEAINSGKVQVVKCGLSDVDDRLAGMYGSELIIVAGRPAMGKTALSTGFMEHIARNYGNVLFFSLEMQKDQLLRRMLSARAQVNGHDIRSGKVTDDQVAKMMQAASDLPMDRMKIVDKTKLPVSYMAAAARRVKREQGLACVMVDYAQLIKPRDERAPRDQQVSNIARDLKEMSKELDVPVIVLAQLNRTVVNRENKRPRMSDLKESGGMEEAADIVMLLHRPDYYDPTDRPGEAELIIDKHRNGETGIESLVFQKWLGKFVSRNPLLDGGEDFTTDL